MMTQYYKSIIYWCHMFAMSQPYQPTPLATRLASALTSWLLFALLLLDPALF